MSDNKNVPSEFRISEKWDKCIENFTLHFAAGLVAGGLTSVVLARTCSLFVLGYCVLVLTLWCMSCAFVLFVCLSGGVTSRLWCGSRCVDGLRRGCRCRFELDDVSARVQGRQRRAGTTGQVGQIGR